jgi:PAS domain S-box-containing protein
LDVGLLKENTASKRDGRNHRQLQEGDHGDAVLPAHIIIKRERLISRITSAIHSSLDSEVVLQSIVNELGEALGVCRCRLAAFSDLAPEVLPITHAYAAQCCQATEPAFNTVPAVDNPFLEALLSSDDPIAVEDVYREPLLAHARDRFKQDGLISMMCAAIRSEGRPIGILSLQHCEKGHSWSSWEIDLVRTVAQQAAVAMRQAELYREVQESATRSAMMNQIITSIRRSLDLNETLKVAVEEIGRALGANRTYFRKLVNDNFVAVAEYLSDPSLSIVDIVADPNDFIGKSLIKSRRTLVMNDVRGFMADNPEAGASVATWQVSPPNLSQVVCPIIVNGHFWGVLSIAQTERQRNWTSAEIALIEVVTAQIEVAVSHSKLFLETKQAAEREALISHIIHGINQSNKLDEIFPIIATELGEHLAADRLIISRHDPKADTWVIDYVYSDGQVTMPGKTYCASEFSSFADFSKNDAVICHDVEHDPRFDPRLVDAYVRPAGTRSFMAVQLRHRGRSRLIICAIMTSGPRQWTPEEADVMRAAVDQVFIALQRAELFEQVSHGKQQWEATFDALTDGILIFDRDGALVRINQAGAAFESAQIGDLIGKPCCELMQGVENEECRVAQVIKTGRPLTFDLVPGRLGRPVLVTIYPLTYNLSTQISLGLSEDDTAIGAVCVVRDLSELRAAEAVAREQRNFLVKLIEHANDAIFAFSPDGRLIWFNEQLVTLSGYSRLELSMSDYRKFVDGDDKKTAMERFGRALDGEPQTFDMRARTKADEERLLTLTFTPIYDESGISSVLTIARDITEARVAAERAAQADKLRALGQLASGVAHNFNNVLAAILGHAQLIKRISPDEGTAQRMEIIERAALDGAETVKRIQAFGLQQNEAGGEVVDLSQLVRDSTELTRASWCDEAQARGLHYEVELNVIDVPLIKGSASELREVFVNIILNALDAMPQGGKLRISTDAYGPNVRTIFRDTGVGMPREVLDHIFEPFFTTKGTSGMGLGLAVSYSIVERHGGRIEAASAPGRGTTFTISIPMAEAPKVRPIPHRIQRPKITSVLVIDDDDRVREALVDMLTSAGHQTEWASTAREGLAKMELGRFDVVFTDLSMPEMDGWTLANEIRRGWPSVKIVLVTGYGVAPDTVTYYRELVDEVVFKPIRFEDISAKLNELVH